MSAPTTDAVVVLATAPKEEEAARIARSLVEEKLAACVNIVAGVRSVYSWEGKVQDDAELLMIVKTSTARSEQVVARILELHSYDTPEAIVLPLVGGSAGYLKWVTEVTAP